MDEHASGPEDVGVSDEELTALALAADPSAPLAADATAWRGVAALRDGLLPDWYMPAPTATGRRSATMVAIGVVVVGLLVIDACGLCITSGFLTWA